MGNIPEFQKSQYCDEAINFLDKHGVECNRKICDESKAKKQYLAGVIKLHPDKGGDSDTFVKYKQAKELVLDDKCYKDNNPTRKNKSQRSNRRKSSSKKMYTRSELGKMTIIELNELCNTLGINVPSEYKKPKIILVDYIFNNQPRSKSPRSKSPRSKSPRSKSKSPKGKKMYTREELDKITISNLIELGISLGLNIPSKYKKPKSVLVDYIFDNQPRSKSPRSKSPRSKSPRSKSPRSKYRAPKYNSSLKYIPAESDSQSEYIASKNNLSDFEEMYVKKSLKFPEQKVKDIIIESIIQNMPKGSGDILSKKMNLEFIRNIKIMNIKELLDITDILKIKKFVECSIKEFLVKDIKEK